MRSLTAYVSCMPRRNLVQLFIADVEESRRIPDRSFSAAEAFGNGLRFCILWHEFPELGRLGAQLEMAWRRASFLGPQTSEDNKECEGQRVEFFHGLMRFL